MATQAQNRAAVNAALQQAATDDLPLLQAFGTANGGNFTTLQTNLATLIGQTSSVARAAVLNDISQQLASVLNQFNALVAATTAAKTATPGG